MARNVSERALLYVFKSEWSKSVTTCYIEKSSFAEGSMRLAFKGRVLIDGQLVDCVLKFSKSPESTRTSYFKDSEMQNLAGLWANSFNELDPEPLINISFVQSYVLELVDRPGRPLCGCERFIDGDFQKHNNNVGAAVISVQKYDEADISAIAQAFSHYTYEASNRQLLVCDIQGVDNIFTDPQIHSLSGKGFGEGNLGITGMRAFLLRHKCNPTCQAYELSPIDPKLLNPAAASQNAALHLPPRSNRNRRVLVETCDEEDAILPPLDSLVPNVSQVHTPQSPSLSRVDIARSPAVSVFDSRLVPAARPSFTLAGEGAPARRMPSLHGLDRDDQELLSIIDGI